MENIIKYLNISFTKGLGNKTIKKVLDVCKSINNIEKYYNELCNEIGESVAEKIYTATKIHLPQSIRILEKAHKEGVSIISIEDKQYPPNLKEIPDPPLVLFVKGQIKELTNAFSVVGTRKPSLYGKKTCRWIVNFLSENNIPVVSGGAIGIDSIAHKTALENNNYTVVVLGSGIDILYPPSNKKLFEKIVENGGAIISEYPFGEKPSKYTFPKRNRIVAGISIATVVVEAPEKSGSLITADLAGQYGRTVFTLPHNIDSPKGAGCNRLIKDGAVAVIDLDSFKEELPYIFTENKANSASFSDKEILLLNVLSEPLSLDEIILKTGLNFDTAVQLLIELEIKGAVSNYNGVYEKITL